jgi:hypothetical protein
MKSSKHFAQTDFLKSYKNEVDVGLREDTSFISWIVIQRLTTTFALCLQKCMPKYTGGCHSWKLPGKAKVISDIKKPSVLFSIKRRVTSELCRAISKLLYSGCPCEAVRCSKTCCCAIHNLASSHGGVMVVRARDHARIDRHAVQCTAKKFWFMYS